MPNTIMACFCTHSYQNSQYGEGRRVFNQTKEQEGKIWRCTVCGKTATKKGDEKTLSKKAQKELDKAKKEAAPVKGSKGSKK